MGRGEEKEGGKKEEKKRRWIKEEKKLEKKKRNRRGKKLIYKLQTHAREREGDFEPRAVDTKSTQ